MIYALKYLSIYYGSIENNAPTRESWIATTRIEFFESSPDLEQWIIQHAYDIKKI